MKAFQRLALLAVFAAVGVGLALGVGASTERPAASDPPRPRWSLASAAAESARPPEAMPGPEKPKPAAEPPAVKRLPAAEPSVALRVLPSGPIAAEVPFPTTTAQTPASNKNLENALDYLLQRMAANPNLVPAAPLPPGSAVPAPPTPGTGAGLPAAPSRLASPTDARANPKPVVKVDASKGGKLVIHLQNTDLRDVLDLLSEQGGLNILAGKEVQGKVTATLTDVDLDSALEAILKSTGYTTRRQGKFIFVGTADEFNNLEQTMDRISTRVYRPNYVPASELKTLLQPLLTEKIGQVSVSSANEVGIAANDSAVGGDKFAGGDVVLVKDYEAVLVQVDQIVAEIDVRPLQVSIEAMILSVALSDADTFGVDFELLKNHMKFGWGSPAASLGDVKFKEGLKFGYLDTNVGVFLQALESIADTNVVAKPHLMVLNKHRAEILIGDKKGYVTTTVTQTSSTQTVDFLETGAQLRLRPFISRDGLIRMEVHPELSDGDVKTENGFTLPNKKLTEVTTNIMVRDGCTVVIGGLIKEQLTNSTSGVPLLGSMPWIGPLFRTSNQTMERRELIVLITPRIVYEPGTCQDGDKQACEFHRRQAVYAEKMNPLGRRSIARRYFRLAQAAWAKGDRGTALRFAEMAVHFDPLSREAIDLRSDIWQGNRVGDHTLDRAEAGPEGDALLDGPAIADWVLNDVKRESPPATAALPHPLDPGQPGTRKEIVRPRRLP